MDLVSRVKSKVAAIQKAMAGATSSIAEIREAIAKLKDEREAIRVAPVPMSEAIPLIDNLLAYWSHAGRPEGIERIAAAVMVGKAPHIELHSPRATLADTLALLVPLLDTQLREAMISDLEVRYAAAPAGLPADERQRRLAELDGEIARLEALEDEAIQAAASGGLEVARRPDASPAALLGIDA
jgi:hypothetical protein